MSYFKSSQPLHLNKTVTITDDEAWHILKSRRLQIGEIIHLQDADDRRFAAEVTGITKQTLAVVPKNEINPPMEPSLAITLFQAIVKEKALDTILQKATELGAFRIILWNAERTPEKITLKYKQKISRWEKITIEAAKQSDRLHAPTITLETDESTLLNEASKLEAIFILDKNAKQTINDIHATHPHFEKIGLVVGPEGGLTGTELEQWSAGTNAYLIKIGPRILRADTAAMAGLTLVQTAWGDLA